MPANVDSARIDSVNHDDVGFLPSIAFGTLVVFYLVWAAMHDIAHADEGVDYTLEYMLLAMSIPAFAFLYRQALRVLKSKSRVAWLIGTGLLITLFNVGSVGSMLHPKYAKDPMLASAFLTAGVPVLGVIGYHLVRERLHRRVQPESRDRSQ